MKISRLHFASIAAGSVLAAGAVTKGLAVAQTGQQLNATMYGSKLGIKGSDGLPHDILIPTNFVVKAGVPVTLTIVNYDEGPHNIFQPELGLNLTMKGGIEQPDKSVKPVTTVLHFTATKTGVFRWYCTLPCDEKHGSWDMKPSAAGPDQDGFMAGYIVVK
jgi:heme/copper-type cytochrome/quinol oxidase subunit 2